MSVFFWIIVLLAVHNASFNREGCYPDYISQKSIQPIKGIFILLIFISHFVQYVKLGGVWDAPYFEIRKFLGQLVVVPFLFYSGYGMAESIRTKGMGYIRRLPLHRVGKVLFQFGIAVVLFLVLRFARGVRYDWLRIALSFIGWESVGNSNWYIFAIVCMYLITWVSWFLFPRRKLPALLCATALVGVYIIVLKLCKDAYWSNTVLAYLAGLWFAHYRADFEKLVLSRNRDYYVYLALIALAFIFMHRYWSSFVVYSLTAVLFALLLVLVTAKVRITSRFLTYCGEHLFSLFILQRIPMIALDGTAIEQHPYVYFLVCLALTFPLSAAFDSLTQQTWNGLLRLVEKKKS